VYNIYIASCCEDGGIYHYILNDDGTFTQKGTLFVDKPMYFTIDGGKMYIILRAPFENSEESGIVVADIGPDGSLSLNDGITSTKGVVACHITVDKGEVYAANYLSGSVIKLDDKIVVHNGHGVNAKRQESAHTHFVGFTPDKKYLLCTDLGIDTIFIYDRNLNEVSSVKMPDGCGPRHLVFSNDGRMLYCVNELDSTVSVLSYNNGTLVLKDTVCAFDSQKLNNTAAAIRIKDNNLYISNRGADTITRFEICGGTLKLCENVLVGGVSPRDFDIIDSFVLCANETSDNVTVLKLDGYTPVLTDTVLKIKAPLCIGAIEV